MAESVLAGSACGGSRRSTTRSATCEQPQDHFWDIPLVVCPLNKLTLDLRGVSKRFGPESPFDDPFGHVRRNRKIIS